MRTKKSTFLMLFKYQLFFFYFTAVYQSLCFLFNVSGFVGLRNSFYYTLIWLIPILIFQKHSKKIAFVIGVFLWLASLPSLFYFLIYKQEFSQSVIYIIFESNIVESNEFLHTYFSWWMIPFFIIYTLIGYIIWKKLSNISIKLTGKIILIPILLLIASESFAKSYVLGNSNFDSSIERQMTKMQCATPWNIVFGYVSYKKVLDNMEKLLSKNSTLPPVKNLVDNSPSVNTVVLVIGESTDRNRMSLYGYKRDTTPNLDKMKDDLIVFKNVYSPRPYTIEVLEQALTFGDELHPDMYLKKVNIINIMKQAGYETYWITNQQTQTKRNTMLTTFSKIADHQVYLNNNRRQNSSSYDEVVLKPFKKVLADKKVKKKFIVVHLLGTHSRYDYRYPDNFNKFTNRKVSDKLNEKETESYNAYDNAVYYNDYVVSNLIKSVKNEKTTASLLYLSDHGEEVFDDIDKKKMGRNEYAPTKAMYTIPFILYGNEKYKENNNYKKLKSLTKRYFTSADLLYTFSDFAKLKYDSLDLSKSIISDKFVQHPVLIGDPTNKKTLRDLIKKPFVYKKIKIQS
ncbi:phosphoethanolamine transferase CptA [Arcobacter sp. CECT 8985]|uniref:phosphoethanolamine transferase CptA n=1 Tax=Arcobacter sp. CECT 8985 TaxID=1935424 RepID=UPI00100B159D|nr:phosphoethanolamine transferase CptA [Arcobacter sp. CECT 8985]RXJ86762.1 hypothetical protein CRU93_07405 [Arcobacter sp. CECT 8985]